MNPEFWHARWEKGEIGFHQGEPNQLLVQLWPELGVPTSTTVLVPLCGKSHDLQWLRHQGYEVLGVEISRLAISQFFTEHGIEHTISDEPRFRRWYGPGITIIEGDIHQLTARDVLTSSGLALYDRAALIALPEVDRRRYAEKIASLLPSESAGLIITVEYPQDEMSGPPFSVEESEVRRLYEPHFGVKERLREDVLARSERFQRRGLTRLEEVVWEVRRK